MSDNYSEETRPLFKLLRTEAFRFVIVRYNHYSLVRRLEDDLREIFPERPLLKINTGDADYRRITDAYFSMSRGFLLLEHFDDALKEERNSLNKESPQQAADNERRRGITAGLNLRRDKLARQPIALFVLLPATSGELYAKAIMEKMPDLWSFRSLMLDLEKEYATPLAEVFPSVHASLPQETMLTADDGELRRLLSLLEKTPETETAYRLTLYPQIAAAASASGQYERAYAMLDAWEQQANEGDKAWIWIQKGDILKNIGKLEEALLMYDQAHNRAEKNAERNHLALSCERLGDTYVLLGRLDRAVSFFERYNLMEQHLYADFPSETTYKNNLAISYGKLGDTHSALGDLQQALTCFEYYNRLQKELYEAFPQNVEYKNNLAISYSQLGDIHSALGDLQQALTYFEDYYRLGKELHEAFSQNVEFKNGLAVSYAKLGETHGALGELQQALTYFEDYNRLEKELHEDFQQKVPFKNILDVSYAKLG